MTALEIEEVKAYKLRDELFLSRQDAEKKRLGIELHDLFTHWNSTGTSPDVHAGNRITPWIAAEHWAELKAVLDRFEVRQ